MLAFIQRLTWGDVALWSIGSCAAAALIAFAFFRGKEWK